MKKLLGLLMVLCMVWTGASIGIAEALDTIDLGSFTFDMPETKILPNMTRVALLQEGPSKFYYSHMSIHEFYVTMLEIWTFRYDEALGEIEQTLGHQMTQKDNLWILRLYNYDEVVDMDTVELIDIGESNQLEVAYSEAQKHRDRGVDNFDVCLSYFEKDAGFLIRINCLMEDREKAVALAYDLARSAKYSNEEIGPKYVIIIDETAAVYEQKAEGFKVLKNAKKGESYGLYGYYFDSKDGNYYFVVDEDSQLVGYVDKSKCQIVNDLTEAPISNSDTGNETQQTVVITNETANIRSNPDSKSDRITTAKKGDTFPLLGVKGTWYKIEVNGQAAYVSQGLCKIEE